MKKNKIHYLCFYAEMNSDYTFFPSAIPKIEYLVEVLKLDFSVQVVSCVKLSKLGFKKSRRKVVDDKEAHLYFSTFNSRFSFINKLEILLRWFQIIYYVFFKIKKGEKLLIYHSLFYYKIFNALIWFIKVDTILQVEELYHAVTPGLLHLEADENRYVLKFRKLLLVSDLLESKFKNFNNRTIVCYGDYRSLDFSPFKKHTSPVIENVNVVYAGVIESSRNAVFFALEVIKLLPNNYFLNIAGFGNNEDVKKLLSEINIINQGKERVKYLGYLTGSEYSNLLLKCDIGLSCHQYRDDELISADNSFPSKIIVYLKHRLVIVSNKINCVINSEVGQHITFFNSTPRDASDAILNVEINENLDSVISGLDYKFKKEFVVFLNQRYNDKC
ncbi:hypothetical protein BXU11_04920 [Flavobacterium sp. LM5]|uniref:hypothetical protein n=1 Tax=Flavobacterium sp. LM5 TaxID=1938610 RepID=UPI000991D970|nr:hypothetical protein [Flavobacterium sp. LM5]OOV29264.1 hypothetical protein BXU11_04920 [Flavobacterium sp. LM5]